MRTVTLEQISIQCTEAEKIARTWFGDVPSCCSLTLLLGPAWVLLKYVLQTIFSGPVCTRRMYMYNLQS